MLLRALTASAALVTILVLAACGGSDDSGRSADTRTSATGTEAQAKRRESGRAASKREDAARSAARGAGSETSQRGSEEQQGSERSPRERAAGPDIQSEIALVQELVRDFVRGLNDRDPSLCTRLFTQRRLEVITKRAGAAAVAKCRRDIRASETKIRLIRIEGVRVAKSGDRTVATQVKFLTRIDGDAVRQLFQLAHSGGRYRLDAALRVEQPG